MSRKKSRKESKHKKRVEERKKGNLISFPLNGVSECVSDSLIFKRDIFRAVELWVTAKIVKLERQIAKFATGDIDTQSQSF